MTTIEKDQANRSYAKKLMLLAWSIELVLVGVGIAIAWSQATAFGGNPDVAVFGVFVILAAVELSKIPAATVFFHAKRFAKVFAGLGLLLVAMISFETIFNGFERYAKLATEPVTEARRALVDIENKIEDNQGEQTQVAKVALEGKAKAIANDAKADDEKYLADLNNQVAAAKEVVKEMTAERQEIEDLISIAKTEKKTAENDIQQRIAKASDTSDVKATQRLIGTKADGAWGPNTDVAYANFMQQLRNEEQQIDNEFKEKVIDINKRIAEIDVQIAAAVEDVNKAEERRDAHRIDMDAREDVRKAADVARREEADSRKQEIENLKSELADLEDEKTKAEWDINVAANESQMHRWTAFMFGVKPEEATEDMVKRVIAAFGAFLGIVGSLAGASVALYAQWFRAMGMQPVIKEVEKIVEKEVEVEKIVEKEVEVEVEVEKIVEKEVEVPAYIEHVYVPVPVGEGSQQALNDMLASLPQDAANELKAAMKKTGQWS